VLFARAGSKGRTCFLRNTPSTRDPLQPNETAEAEDEYENEHKNGLIRDELFLLLPLQRNGQTAKEHPTGGSNTGLSPD
jgi:hypothetical protein